MNAATIRRSVAIDSFASSAPRHRGRAIVAIDVIRATTLAITAVAEGRRCIIARDADDARAIRHALGDVLLTGEIGGDMPASFDMNNSPAELVERVDQDRPIVMVSSSGAGLMLEAQAWSPRPYVACLRNVSAIARHLADHETHVTLIGAGSRGEFREEDQLACAWIGARLVDAGFALGDDTTESIIARWRGASVLDIERSNSVGYLRRSGQYRDFEFITSHIDDLGLVTTIRGQEVRPIGARIGQRALEAV